VTVAAETYD